MNIQNLATNILKKRTEISADRSMLVAVSGIDGSGKGYITNKLVAELNLQGVQAISINIDPWLTLPEQRFNPENPGEHFYHHAFVFEDLFQQLVQFFHSSNIDRSTYRRRLPDNLGLHSLKFMTFKMWM